ncbi:MAG: hypothetical protein WCG95_09470 [bacterium]
MSLLIFAYRRQEIIRRKNEMNFKLLALEKQLMDLHSYSASISDNTVSLRDLMESPPSMFNRMSIFMVQSHQSADAGAREKFPYMQQMAMSTNPQFQDPKNAELKQQYEKSLYAYLYKQGREEFGKREEKLLNQQDLKIQQAKSKLETQVKMLDSEETKVAEQEDKAAEKSAPKYVA